MIPHTAPKAAEPIIMKKTKIHKRITIKPKTTKRIFPSTGLPFPVLSLFLTTKRMMTPKTKTIKLKTKRIQKETLEYFPPLSMLSAILSKSV